MKKKTILYLFIMALMLSGCVKFHDDPTLSVWSDGLWIIPTLTGAGSVACLIIAFFFQNKGSKKYNDVTGKYDYSDKPVPFYKRWGFIWGAGLVIATIAIIWLVVSER